MMSDRFWYQSMAPIQGLEHYRRALHSHAKQACASGVEVFFNGVDEERYRGRMPAEVHRYAYAKMLLQMDAIESGLRAQKENFSAYILGSFSEPYLKETRSALDIPVISLAEAALFTACSLAEQFALITLAPAYARRMRGVVQHHGVQSRMVGIFALTKERDEADVNAAFLAPDEIISEFKTAARLAIAAGADLVIPSEGLLSELLYENGVNTVDGATVLDSVGAALLKTEMLVNAKRRLGLGVSRSGAYAKAPDELLTQLRSDKRLL